MLHLQEVLHVLPPQGMKRLIQLVPECACIREYIAFKA